MFSIGETVLYGCEGVCVIERLEEMKVGRNRAQYYVLRPVSRNSSTLFVPADNEQLLQRMRPLLTKEELHALLTQTAQAEGEWIDDAAQRKTAFQEVLSGGERGKILQMLRLVHLHRRELAQRGKHLRIADEQFLRDAEKLFRDEFAYVLKIPQGQVNDYVRSYVE